jgi:hypothetical protein
VIVLGDRGYRLRVTVTATNASGSASADSATKDVTGAPVNLSPPTITGTAQAGSTLTAQPGSWTGVPAPTFTYQWALCNAAGLACVNIGGATAATYVPVGTDVGSTLLVKVSASNTGGASGPISSAVTPVVVAAPTGGGGGGGGGGAGNPDVIATLTASPASPGVGSTLTYVLTATLAAGSPSANDVVATINLPAQVTLFSTTVTRGQGCTGTTTLTCNLDFLSTGLVATVQIVTTINGTGSLVATASLTTTPADSNTANNTASVTTTVAGPPPPPPPPPPPLPALKQLGSRTLSGVQKGKTETIATRFSTNEALRLKMTATRLRSTSRLRFLKGTHIANKTLVSGALVVTASATHAGTYSLKGILTRAALVKGKTYVIHLTATNAKGKTTTLAIRFRA